MIFQPTLSSFARQVDSGVKSEIRELRANKVSFGTEDYESPHFTQISTQNDRPVFDPRQVLTLSDLKPGMLLKLHAFYRGPGGQPCVFLGTSTERGYTQLNLYIGGGLSHIESLAATTLSLWRDKHDGWSYSYFLTFAE